MTDLLGAVVWIVQLKHQAGRHDQKKHDPHKGGNELKVSGEYTITPFDGDEGYKVYKLKPGDNMPANMMTQSEYGDRATSVAYNKLTNTWHIPGSHMVAHEDIANLALEGKKYKYDPGEIIVRGYLDANAGTLEVYDFTKMYTNIISDPMERSYVLLKSDKAMDRAFSSVDDITFDGKKLDISAQIQYKQLSVRDKMYQLYVTLLQVDAIMRELD